MTFWHTVVHSRTALLCIVLSLLSNHVMGNPLQAPIVLEPGVSLPLAQERAANIRDLRYGLFFDLPEDASAPIWPLRRAGHA